MDVKKEKWEESYSRNENFIFYPRDEVVKFLNRFIRKRTGLKEYVDILDFSKIIRGLDYGCGIGRQTILMQEFGVESYGVDVSEVAITTAKELARNSGYSNLIKSFSLVNGTSIPFDEKYFDFTLCLNVLDSMNYELAKNIMQEIDRVTKRYAFIGLLGGDDHAHFREYSGEEVVDSRHEFGTIQSYFNVEKIKQLIHNTKFSINWAHLITDESILSKYKSALYYLVLEK